MDSFLVLLFGGSIDETRLSSLVRCHQQVQILICEYEHKKKHEKILTTTSPQAFPRVRRVPVGIRTLLATIRHLQAFAKFQCRFAAGTASVETKTALGLEHPCRSSLLHICTFSRLGHCTGRLGMTRFTKMRITH